jgi:hypothetical protein
MLVCVMHISNEKTDWRVLLRRFAHICELPPVEARMLVDDDMISEDIDPADRDDGFADVKRIELPVSYARQNILIQELARVEQVFRSPGPIKGTVLWRAKLAAWRCSQRSVAPHLRPAPSPYGRHSDSHANRHRRAIDR